MFSPSSMDTPRYMGPQAENTWTAPNWRPLPMQVPILRDPATCLTIEEGPERLRRYGWAVINILLKSASQPTDVIKQALESLQRTTTRLRLTHPSIPPFSETQARFWVELAHAAIRPRFRSPAGSQYEECIEKFPSRYLDYNTFSAHPEVELAAWKKNYTEGRWNSVAARIEFVQPDLTPLPDVIHYPWLDKSANIICCDRKELPPIEELSFQAFLLIKNSEALLSSGTAESPIISNHSHLLTYLFTNLFTKYTGEDEKHPENASSQKAQRARSLLFEMSGPYLDSITQRGFWIHHIMTAVVPEEIGKKQTYVVPTFRELLLHNLHLAFEDLPMTYYSLHRWVSEEGKEVVLEPDRLRIPGFLWARM